MANERSRAWSRRRHYLRRFGQGITDVTVDEDLRLRREAVLCPLCGVVMTNLPFLPHSKEFDHIVTAAHGGAHELSNIRVICRACNNHARVVEHGTDGQLREFYRAHPELDPERRAA
ncbi:MAG TPA: HNH endonuclease [Solirubrobacteraceae bacterium]|nr:HNH endonuclease [Solirubrobacteraceae bacterium]